MTKNDHRYQVKENAKDIAELKKDMKRVLTNEIPHIYSALREIKTDVAWLKKSFWLVATASVGALVTGVINLL